MNPAKLMRIHVNIEEKLLKEIKEKYNINPIMSDHSLFATISFEEFRLLLFECEDKIELVNAPVTLGNILNVIGKNITKKFIEIFYHIYKINKEVKKDKKNEDEYEESLNTIIIIAIRAGCDKEIIQYCIEQNLMYKLPIRMLQMIHTLLYYGKIDEYYDILLTHEKELIDMTTKKLDMQETMIMSNVFQFNQVKFLKYILSKVSKNLVSGFSLFYYYLSQCTRNIRCH